MEIFLDENLKKIFTIEKLRYYRNLMGALNKSSFVPGEDMNQSNKTGR